MRIVGPFSQVIGRTAYQVTDIMQQRGDHERSRRIGRLREIGGLQAMLGHRDGFTVIGDAPCRS